MTHHKISLPCAYLGLCLCLFPIPLNDCKTPNVSRRLKAEGISSLNPTACSHSSGSWTHFGFDCTFPAPLCRAGPGRWPGTRTWERPCISVCAAHQTPENGSCSFQREGLLVCFEQLSPQRHFGKEWPGTRGGSGSQQLFCSHQKPPRAWRSTFPILPNKGCATALKAPTGLNIPELFWEEKCIFNTNFQIAPSQALCGLQHPLVCLTQTHLAWSLYFSFCRNSLRDLQAWLGMLSLGRMSQGQMDWGGFGSNPALSWALLILIDFPCTSGGRARPTDVLFWGFFAIPAQKWIFFPSKGKDFSHIPVRWWTKPGEFIINDF